MTAKKHWVTNFWGNHIFTQSQINLVITKRKRSLQWKNLLGTHSNQMIKFNISHSWTIQYHIPANVMY